MGKASDFTINGTLQSTLGYDATHGETLTLALESAPAIDVWHVEFRVIIASKNAPNLVVSPDPMTRTEPPWEATVTAPLTGAHTYQIACVVNGGVDSAGRSRPDYTSERIICIRSAGGLRKWLPAESTQYSARGWSDEQNDAVDAEGGGSSTPSAIVVDRAILSQVLEVLSPGYIAAPNTITGTGALGGLPVGTTLLIIAPGRPGFIDESGWYELTTSTGSAWTMTRMAGTEADEVVPAGQTTVCRDAVDTWEDWTGGLPIFVASGVGVHEWILANDATMASMLSVEQASFAPAVDVPHVHGEWGALEGGILTHPLATPVEPGFMSSDQVQQLAALAGRVVTVDMFIDELDDTLSWDYTPTTMTGTGTFTPGDPPVGLTSLYAAKTPAAEHGWYEVTTSDGSTLVLTRIAGLDTSESVYDRTVTVVRGNTDPPTGMVIMLVDTQWPGGVLGTDTLAFEWVINGAAGGGADLSDATPLAVGTASGGTSIDASRADHVHAHGDQLGGSLHADATTVAAGFMPTAAVTQLAALPSSLPAADVAPTADKLVTRGASGEMKGAWATVGTTKLPTTGLLRVGDGNDILTVRNSADSVDFPILSRSGNSFTFKNWNGATYGDDFIFDFGDQFTLKRRGAYIANFNGNDITVYTYLKLHLSMGGRITVTGSSGTQASLEAAPNSAGAGGDVNLKPGNGTTTHGATNGYYGSTAKKFATSSTGLDVTGVVATPPHAVTVSSTGTTTLDCALSRVHVVTLNAATCTLALTNTRGGASYEVHLVRGIDSVVTLGASFEGYAAADTATVSLDATHAKALLAGTCLAEAGVMRVHTRREQA